MKAEVHAICSSGSAASGPGFRYGVRDLMEVHPVLTEPRRAGAAAP